MWEEIFKLALGNGIWAVLFLGLLLHQLKENATREKKYQDTIYKLADRLSVVEDIKQDIEEIKVKLK